MEVVTSKELADYFERLTGSIEALGAKLTQQSQTRVQEYFTREEAAEYLRLSQSTFDKFVANSSIRRAKLGSAQQAGVLFRRSDLDAWFDSKREMDADGIRSLARRQGR